MAHPKLMYRPDLARRLCFATINGRCAAPTLAGRRPDSYLLDMRAGAEIPAATDPQTCSRLQISPTALPYR